jgi:hypothetical protein
VPAIIKTEKVLVPDQTTIADNRELKRRIIANNYSWLSAGQGNEKADAALCCDYCPLGSATRPRSRPAVGTYTRVKP